MRIVVGERHADSSWRTKIFRDGQVWQMADCRLKPTLIQSELMNDDCPSYQLLVGNNGMTLTKNQDPSLVRTQ
jgi:hypothetical protein